MLLGMSTAVIFGAGAARLGFYNDDIGFLHSLPRIGSLADLWGALRGFVPGRNLHPLWHYLFFRLSGGSLPWWHLWQSAFDGLAVAGAFLVFRRLQLAPAPAVLAAGLFAFWPFHGETHFWMLCLPMSLVSTLLLLGFALTTLELLEDRPRLWLHALDAVLFSAALFTYDQVLPVLVLILILRVVLRRTAAFAAFHGLHVAALSFWVWLRSTQGGAKPMPPALSEIPSRVAATVSRTLSDTFGHGALTEAYRLWTKATAWDWALSIAAGLLVAALAARQLRCEDPQLAVPIRYGRLAALAVLALLAAYLPVWLWWPSPRHHYLPSLGLFGACGAGLGWLLSRTRGRTAQFALVFLAGVPICLAAAADRGESHFWEESFQARREMFAELRNDLDGQDALILADFPYFHGPAMFLAPLDALWGPELFFQPPLARPPATGSIGWAPASEGVYLFTHNLDGPASFWYLPTHRFLVVQFRSWENGKLVYEKNPARPLSYRVLSSEVSPAAAGFAVTRFSARRDTGELLVSLRLTAAVDPGTYLTVLFGFRHGPGFRHWERVDTEGNSDAIPVLLSDPGPAPRTGRFAFDQTLRLKSFPPTDRLKADFYLASPAGFPAPLGRAEAAVEQ